MSTQSTTTTTTDRTEQRATVDMKFEVVVLPVADAERSKVFYESLGWRLDADFVKGESSRVLQFTPPGSEASIIIGNGITSAVPGSVQGLQLVVEDVARAREELLARGVEVGEVQTFPWGSFVFFRDPDGNGWAVQQLPPREEAPAG